jgi:hypothetical protein
MMLFITNKEKKLTFSNICDLFMRMTMRLIGFRSRSVCEIADNYHQVIEIGYPALQKWRKLLGF